MNQAQQIAKAHGTTFSPRVGAADGAHSTLTALPLDAADALVEALEDAGFAAYAREVQWPESGRALVFVLDS